MEGEASLPHRAPASVRACIPYGMPWVVLCIAGVFEIAWAVGLKYTEGFTRLWPSVGTLVALVISMALLGVAVRTLPLGTAYAVWTGIGSVGTAILGVVLFREPATAMRLACIALIVAGIVGLKLTATPERGQSASNAQAEADTGAS